MAKGRKSSCEPFGIGVFRTPRPIATGQDSTTRIDLRWRHACLGFLSLSLVRIRFHWHYVVFVVNRFSWSRTCRQPLSHSLTALIIDLETVVYFWRLQSSHAVCGRFAIMISAARQRQDRDGLTDPWRVNRRPSVRRSPLICSTPITCSQYDIDRRVNVPWNAIIGSVMPATAYRRQPAVVITTTIRLRALFCSFSQQETKFGCCVKTARRSIFIRIIPVEVGKCKMSFQKASNKVFLHEIWLFNSHEN